MIGGGGGEPNKGLKKSTLLGIRPQLEKWLLKVRHLERVAVVSLNLCWLQWIVHFHSGEKSSKHPLKLSQTTLATFSDSLLSIRMLSVLPNNYHSAIWLKTLLLCWVTALLEAAKLCHKII